MVNMRTEDFELHSALYSSNYKKHYTDNVRLQDYIASVRLA